MEQKSTILIIEDEENIASFIERTLAANNYRTICAYTGKEAMTIIPSRCPEVILLDLGLPDMDGMDIIRQVRSWSSSPIIVVSARNQEHEKVLALDAGADDYITKPFGTCELLARIRTSLRHSNRMNTNSPLYLRPYQANGLYIDFEKHVIKVDDEIIHLTPVEYNIVSYLAKNSGKVMTHSAIMANVWGPFIEDDNKILRVNMANIRRKLEKNPAQPEYIFTEVGVGYRMIDG